MTRPDVEEGLRKAVAATRAMITGDEAVTVQIRLTLAPRRLPGVSVVVLAEPQDGDHSDLLRYFAPKP